ncbi:MAG: hypothetical protein KDE35_06345 [Geminicoccaceae bacterium]|nr:hypothetical protein [Geminicoccaceae bacterium]
MPPLLVFLLRHALIGFALAAVAGVALMAGDVAGMRGLVHTTEGGYLAFAALCFLLGLTFASVQMGAAVMLLRPEREPDDRGLVPLGYNLQPARIRRR